MYQPVVEGFHRQSFPVMNDEGVLIDKEAYMRMTPADGNCMFWAISAALWFSQYNFHPDFGNIEFCGYANNLRKVAVDALEDSSRTTLVLGGGSVIERLALLQMAAAEMDVRPADYCRRLRENRSWGGGPELIALCNIFARPIFIYEPALLPQTGAGTGAASENIGAAVLRLAPIERVRRVLSPSPPCNRMATPEVAVRQVVKLGWPEFADEQPIDLLFCDARFPSSWQGSPQPASMPQRIRSAFVSLLPNYHGTSGGQRKNNHFNALFIF